MTRPTCHVVGKLKWQITNIFIIVICLFINDTSSSHCDEFPLSCKPMVEIIGIHCDNRTHIAWKYNGFDQNNIKNLHIQYHTDLNGTWKREPVHGRNYVKNVEKVFRIFIHNPKCAQRELTPGRNYTFQLIETDDSGKITIPFPSKSCLSRAEVPYKNPSNFSLQFRNSSKDVVARWNPLSPVDHNGPDFKYILKWKADSQNVSSWNETNIKNCKSLSNCSAVVKIDDIDLNYIFQLVSANKLGNSTAEPINKTLSIRSMYMKKSLESESFLSSGWILPVIITAAILLLAVPIVIGVIIYKRRQFKTYDFQVTSGAFVKAPLVT